MKPAMTAKPLTPDDLNSLIAEEELQRHLRMVAHAEWCAYIVSERTKMCSCGASPNVRPNHFIDITPK